MDAIDLDSLDDIKDISFDLGSSRKPQQNSFKPNLITRDPPSRGSSGGAADSSFGLDLIMNKDKQKRRNNSPSPANSPRASPSFQVEEPKSSFSNNMYSNIDNNTPRLKSNPFNVDSFLDDELESVKPTITKLGDSPSPIEIKPPSNGGGMGFNFDDDILSNNGDSNGNSGGMGMGNGNGNNMGGDNHQYGVSNNGGYNNNSGYGGGNSGMYGGSNEPPMSVEEMQKKKFELLCKLERLKKKGVVVPRTYTMNSSYEEIKFEYDKLHNERLMENSVKMYRQMMISVTTGVEYLNNKVNPFDVYLDGWSDQVYSQQHDYDEIFEELYEKYKDKGSMPPELRLMLSLGGSALMYHLSNTMFKSVLPGAQDILRQNPDLMKHMQQTLLNTMSQQGPNEAAFAGMMGGAMNQGGQYNPTSQGSPNAPPRMTNPPANPNQRRQMNGPDLDTFLDDITGSKNINL
jgi:hypothetical protein